MKDKLYKFKHKFEDINTMFATKTKLWTGDKSSLQIKWIKSSVKIN